jgi:hypothetical protein
MAHLFSESFDWTTSTADLQLGKWTTLVPGVNPTDTITSAAGARGTNGLRLSSTAGAANRSSNTYMKVLTPSGNRCVVGFRFRSNGAFTNLAYATSPDSTSLNTTLLRIRLTNATNCWFRPNAAGTIAFYRGTTLLGTSTTALSPTVEYYLEFNVLVQSSGGSAALYINGVLDATLNLSGIDTANGADGWDEVSIPWLHQNNQGVTWDIDDVYINDGSGSTNNTVLGPTKIDLQFPSADGDTVQFTPSAGSNYQNVDEAVPDGDTTYNETSTVGHDDLYAFPVWSGAGTINAVQVVARTRTTGGSSTAALTVKSNGTIYDGATHGISSSYADIRQIWEVDPDDSLAFDPGTNLQFGLTKLS